MQKEFSSKDFLSCLQETLKSNERNQDDRLFSLDPNLIDQISRRKESNGKPNKENARLSVSSRKNLEMPSKPNLSRDVSTSKTPALKVLHRQYLHEKAKSRHLQVQVDKLIKSVEEWKVKYQETKSELEEKVVLISTLRNELTNTHDTPNERIKEFSQSIESIDDIDIDGLLTANLDPNSLHTLLDGTLSDLDLDVHRLENDALSTSTTCSSKFDGENPIETTFKKPLLNKSIPTLEGVGDNIYDENKVCPTIDEVSSKKFNHGNSIKFPKLKKVSPLKLSKNNNNGGYEVIKVADVDDKIIKKKGGADKVEKNVSNANARCLSCDECGKQFPLGGQWKLKRHKELMHEAANLFSCLECPTKFEFKSSLEAHKEAHRYENPWRCNICKVTYMNLTLFVRHVKKDHEIFAEKTAKDKLSTNRISIK